MGIFSRDAARGGKAVPGDRALSHRLPEHVSFPPVALPTDTSADTAWKLPWPALLGCAFPLLPVQFLSWNSKLGSLTLKSPVFYSYQTQVKSPGHSQIWCSCRWCGCTLCNGFIFACWIGLHGSRSVLRDPPKPLQHILPGGEQVSPVRAAMENSEAGVYPNLENFLFHRKILAIDIPFFFLSLSSYL